MRTRFTLIIVLVAAAVVAFAWWQSPKSGTPPIIQVRGSDLLIQNQTDNQWSDIEVWVNDHYRGLASSLAGGQVLTVPLNSLVAGYGQRFDTTRQRVFGVLVTARSSDGENVRLAWGNVRRK